ncbi:MAG: YecA family protein [Ahniella sp.]|nr:YecA family protein [Ahniella sp.]
MTDTPPYGLTDEELEELNEYFANNPGPYQFGLDAAHGLLTAVVVAPEPVAASEWLPLLIEDEEGFGDADLANRVLALIVRLYNSVVQELEAFTYQPIYAETDVEEGGTRLSPKGWCEGFAAGIDLRSEIWGTRLGSDPRLIELMDPIIRLSAEEGVLDIDVEDAEETSDEELLPGEQPLHEPPAGEVAETEAQEESGAPEHPLTHMLEPMSEPDYDAALNGVAAAVADIQQYWRDFRPGQDESFADAPKLIRRKRGGQWVH